MSFVFICVFPYLYRISFDGENIQTIVNTNYNHINAPGMGNYHGEPLVVGGDPRVGDNKTEMLLLETLTWEEMEDFPFADK